MGRRYAVCVILSMAGVILVTTADGHGGKKPHGPKPVSSALALNMSTAPRPTPFSHVGVRRNWGEDASPTKRRGEGGGVQEPVQPTPVVPTDVPHTLGDVLSLVSAVLFAIYSVLVKWLIPSEKNIRMPMFFGFTGVFAAIICVPLLAILHVTNVERMRPLPSRVAIYLTANGMIGTPVQHPARALLRVCTVQRAGDGFILERE